MAPASALSASLNAEICEFESSSVEKSVFKFPFALTSPEILRPIRLSSFARSGKLRLKSEFKVLFFRSNSDFSALILPSVESILLAARRTSFCAVMSEFSVICTPFGMEIFISLNADSFRIKFELLMLALPSAPPLLALMSESTSIFPLA